MAPVATGADAIAPGATVHGSAVLFGAHALLIRGPSGAGKSRLALALIEAGAAGGGRFARLVADDRVALEACHGRLLVRAPAQLAGLIEVRGVGIRRLPHEAMAVVGLAIDLAAADASRLPDSKQTSTIIAGIKVPRVGILPGSDPMPPLLAILASTDWASQLMKK